MQKKKDISLDFSNAAYSSHKNIEAFSIPTFLIYKVSKNKTKQNKQKKPI